MAALSDAASDTGDVEPLEVTLAVRSCSLNQCSGFLGYMDIFVTVDWTDHRSRTARLSRTPTAWGCTTEATWECACPPKVWYRNQGEHFEVNQLPSSQPQQQQQPQLDPGSVTFSVFQEALGGFGTPSLLGTAFGIMEDFVEADSLSSGSRENEYVLALNGEVTGNIHVDCTWIPATVSRRGAMFSKSNLLGVGSKPSNANARVSARMSSVKPRATVSQRDRLTVAAFRSEAKIIEGDEDSSDSSDEDLELDDDIMKRVQAHMSSHDAKKSLEATLGMCTAPTMPTAGKSIFLRKSLAPMGGLSANIATTADLKSSAIKLTETRKKSDEEIMMDNMRRSSAMPTN